MPLLKKNNPTRRWGHPNLIFGGSRSCLFFFFWQHLYGLHGPIRSRILWLHHDFWPTSHFGYTKTQLLVSGQFCWSQMGHDVKQYVYSCATCAWTKKPSTRSGEHLQPLPTPTWPWSTLYVDFIVELQCSENCSTVMVIMDALTKMVHFVLASLSPLPANLFLLHIFHLYGFPTQVLSYHGPQFIPHFWHEFCKALAMEPLHLSAYHPQTKRQTEHINQTLETCLNCFLNVHQDNWVPLFPLAKFPS